MNNKIITVTKPWGEEKIFAITNDYIGKICIVKKNRRLGLAYHLFKDETIYIRTGKAKLMTEDENGKMQEYVLNEADSVRIRSGRKHRLEALEDCEFFEVSSPEFDDHLRVEDDYGRENDFKFIKNSVCCVGGVCVNLILSTFDAIPRFGTATTINKMLLRTAGESLNVAFPLAKLNIPVYLVTCITKDEYGKMIFRDILKYSINTKGINVVENDKTGITACLINKDGDRSLIDYRGVKSKITERTIYKSLDYKKSPKYIYFGGYYNHPGIGFEGYLNMFIRLRELGKVIFLDTSWDPRNFDKQSIKEVLEIFKYVDVFLPNYEEGRAISKKEEPSDIIEFFRKKGINSLFLKLGDKGSIGFYKGEIKSQAPFSVKVKDTVCAGDSFNAGVIYGFMKGYNLDQILKFSTAIASWTISRDEDRYPTLEEAQSFEQQNKAVPWPEASKVGNSVRG